MSVDGDLLEQIVAGVLKELAGGAASSSPVEPTVPSATKELILTEKVVTADLLEKTYAGATKLVIGGRAVVTPSARDFLKQNKVELRRESTTTSQTSGAKTTTTANWKLIVVHTTKTLASVLDDATRRPGAVWQRELAGCDVDAADRAISALCRGESDGAVVFTRRPEVVACRANRNANVRGAAIVNVAQLRSAHRRMGTNLYCIDPETRTHGEWNNLLREIASCGKPERPEHWKE